MFFCLVNFRFPFILWLWCFKSQFANRRSGERNAKKLADGFVRSSGGKFYDLINSIYSNTKCSIKCGNQRTEYFNYCKGVRQGCILSPMLFNLYLNEIPSRLDNNDTDGILLPNGSRLNCLLYADDLVLISNSTKGLQNALTILSQFYEDWLLNVNAKKTKILIFKRNVGNRLMKNNTSLLMVTK